MLSLLEFQLEFRRAVLGGDADVIAGLTVDDGLLPDQRLAVYRNNVVASLTAALQDTFPVTRRIVDGRFFAFAVQEFIRTSPPARPCLAEYGAALADFLAAFPPSRELVYLPDVARLEWLLHRAAQAPEIQPMSPTSLHAVPAEDTERLRLQFLPALGYFQSRWPIDRIWCASQDGGSDETIDLDAGGTLLEVGRPDGGVEFRQLPAAVFAFRRALSAGETLGIAAEAALTLDDDVDVTVIFADLFRDGIVAEFALSPKDPA
jgi:hypothetical protein